MMKAWSRVKACQAWHPNLAKETWPILIFTGYYQCQCEPRKSLTLGYKIEVHCSCESVEG